MGLHNVSKKITMNISKYDGKSIKQTVQYELDVKYKNVNPIKVLDPEGGIQYYEGGFNSQGQAHGKGIFCRSLLCRIRQ